MEGQNIDFKEGNGFPRIYRPFQLFHVSLNSTSKQAQPCVRTDLYLV